ncbi:MAG TPA: SidA/IucD/PvdA family monooxygenase [Thermoanaerobaculia bacterium]|nr:SidA/IucD/PvdA family monooxygenase [Thermoanaerobaculia bacterium]
MKTELRQPEREVVHDVLGIGFGPANLALAAALEEEAEAAGGRDLRRIFLERKPKPVWHPGMLIEDSLIQISVLKDLVTVRNPQSRFTFLNYLKIKERLFEFLNLRDLFPTRIEFNDYLCWAAGELSSQVRFGREVVSVAPAVKEDREIELLRVVARDVTTGESEEYLTRNLVLATGGVPCFPEGIALAGGRAFHSSESMLRLDRDFPDKDAPYRFVVVGSGQSAAELFYHLITRYRNADVTATIRRYAYKPVNDSHFTNEIFFPQMVDFLYTLPEGKRRMIQDDCKDVNYAVVDTPLIRQIYRCLYQEKVLGRDRARILPYLHLEELAETEGVVMARFRDLLRDQEVFLEADGLILCTGYRWPKEHPLLDGLSGYIQKNGSNEYKVERDYSLTTAPSFSPGIFLQGFAEGTHGASETVLSLVAIRAGDILKSLLARFEERAAVENYTV